MARLASWLFSKTLNNVWFGILTMMLIAVYVAVGSGFPGVREYFEMDELAFFNAWPLKVLMALLVANLVTVTFLRIPFTAPRYGVWMIHTGIVTLIYGMAYYYSFKQEGLAFIPTGGSVSEYYDRWERSLYVRVDGVNTGDEHVLTSLPRFNVYDQRTEDKGRLHRSDLRNISPVVVMRGEGGTERYEPLTKLLGVKGELKFDVVGYWPYANMVTEWVQPKAAPADGGLTGIKVDATDAKGELLARAWAVSGDDVTGGREMMGELEIEHRELPDEATARQILLAATRMHQLEVTLAGKTERLAVELGGTYDAGGYKIEVEAFDPAWRTMQGETVKLLTLKITPPADSAMKGEMFKRQVIPGRERVTDWKQGGEGAGPMGTRQSEPLDKDFVTRYTFNDSLGLLPSTGREKRTFITTSGGAGGAGDKMWMVTASAVRPARVTEIVNGRAEMTLGAGDDRVVVTAERLSGLRRVDDVRVVPSEKRTRTGGETGLFQVMAVRVTLVGGDPGGGDWTRTVLVPFQQWALNAPWKAGVVRLPGTDRRVQMQLGNRVRPIAPHPKTGRPAQVTLDKFELVSYAGGSPMAGMQRDFKSSLTVTEGDGSKRQDKAHMNNPVYFGGSPVANIGDTYWTLFQAQWDPEGQRFTVLGVGNRPGVWIQTAGCVILTVGLMYAFYVKPLIIKRMKEKAIAEAKAKGKKVPTEPAPRSPVVMEGVEGRVSV